MKNKLNIGVIGCGNVGATTAFGLLHNNLVKDLKLFDINKPLVHGTVCDLQDCIFGINKNINIKYSDLKEMVDCDYVVITAGKNQLPNQSRDELFSENKKIIKDIIKEIGNTKAKIILATNPVDKLTEEINQKLNKNIISTGNLLDTYRLRLLTNNMKDYCIGEHGERIDVVLNGNNRDYSICKTFVRDRALHIIEKKGCTQFGIATAIINIIKKKGK